MEEHYKQHGAMDEAMASYFLEKREKNVSKGTHTCDICGKTFGFLNSIQAHIKLAHASECLLCGEIVKHMKIHMKDHMKVKNKRPERATCPICKLDFSKDHLKSHIKNMHEKTKKCTVCEKIVKFHEMRT